MKWISVKDQVPDRGSQAKYSDDVLVFVDGGIEIAYYCLMDKRWYDIMDEEVIYGVKYWMPLPPKPEDA